MRKAVWRNTFSGHLSVSAIFRLKLSRNSSMRDWCAAIMVSLQESRHMWPCTAKNSETAKRQQTLNQIIIARQRRCNGQWQSGICLMHAFRLRCKRSTASNTIHYRPIPEFSQCDNVVIHTCTSSENCGYISCRNVILMMTACFTQSVERERRSFLTVLPS